MYNRMLRVAIGIILAKITYLSMFLDLCPEVIPSCLACASRLHTALHVKANITVLIKRAIPIGKKNQMLFDSISNKKKCINYCIHVSNIRNALLQCLKS